MLRYQSGWRPAAMWQVPFLGPVPTCMGAAAGSGSHQAAGAALQGGLA